MINNQNQDPSLQLIGNLELDGFKEKTERLMNCLENNKVEEALKCINDINEINGKNFYSTIGKLTRGLHNAISNLSISSNEDDSENNKTRVDLNYVIDLTADATKKTLDMTESSMTHIKKLKESNQRQSELIESYLTSNNPDKETASLIQKLIEINEHNIINVDQANKNNTEIIIAQNYQDITSQSITKAMTLISEVETSLVTLTQHANLLSKLSQFDDKQESSFDLEESKELKSDLEQMNTVKESEHLDQSDVDNLLSSLGF